MPGDGQRDETLALPSRTRALFAVSLRASALASGIALLLGDMYVRTLSVIDSTGPRRTVRPPAAFRDWAQHTDFVLVSDFIVGGSELRAAETFAHMHGGRLLAAASIGTALPGAEYNSECSIDSLCSLSSVTEKFKCTFLD